MLSKEIVSIHQAEEYIVKLLEEIQNNLFKKASERTHKMTHTVDSFIEFKRLLDEEPGFILAHWDGTPETEEK